MVRGTIPPRWTAVLLVALAIPATADLGGECAAVAAPARHQEACRTIANSNSPGGEALFQHGAHMGSGGSGATPAMVRPVGGGSGDQAAGAAARGGPKLHSLGAQAHAKMPSAQEPDGHQGDAQAGSGRKVSGTEDHPVNASTDWVEGFVPGGRHSERRVATLVATMPVMTQDVFQGIHIGAGFIVILAGVFAMCLPQEYREGRFQFQAAETAPQPQQEAVAAPPTSQTPSINRAISESSEESDDDTETPMAISITKKKDGRLRLGLSNSSSTTVSSSTGTTEEREQSMNDSSGEEREERVRTASGISDSFVDSSSDECSAPRLISQQHEEPEATPDDDSSVL